MPKPKPSAAWPPGLRPHGGGIQIRIRQGGYNYSEVIQGSITKASDVKAAIARRNELLSRIRLGLPLYADEKKRVSQFGDDAQNYLNGLELDYSTADGYRGILQSYWLPVFEKKISQEITASEIKNVLDSWSVVNKTKRNRLGPLKALFDFIGVSPNPVSQIKISRRSRKKNTNHIERFLPAERDAIMAALQQQADPQITAYFALLFGCGLRPSGEVLGILQSDYDGASIRIHQSVVRRRLKLTTKTHMARTVFVPTWVRAFLNPLIKPAEMSGAEDFLFVNSRGDFYHDSEKFNTAWKAAINVAMVNGKKIKARVPYVCRHTRAAELLSMGVEPAEAASQLGHSLDMFFNTYSEWIDRWAKHRDVSRLEGVPLSVASEVG